MTGSWWWDLLVGVAAALAVTWLALIVTLAIVRPRGGLVHEALRLLPDVLRLVRRLSADPDLPAACVRLALLLAYLAVPLDLVPDFIPVLGYADDAIIVTAVLRSVVRRAGLGAVRRHWPGNPDGFTVLPPHRPERVEPDAVTTSGGTTGLLHPVSAQQVPTSVQTPARQPLGLASSQGARPVTSGSSTRPGPGAGAANWACADPLRVGKPTVSTMVAADSAQILDEELTPAGIG